MSNSDFEDRLSRIKAAGGQQPTVSAGSSKKKSSVLRGIIIGAITVNVGAQLIRVTNANYESIRDQYGIPAALGLVVGSIALMVIGVVLTIRALFRIRSANTGQSSLAYAAAESKAQMQPTSSGLGWSRRFGLAFLACLVMSTGLYLIRVANRNYDSIKEEYGVAAALGMGLGSFAVLILSIILFFRAVRPVVPSASVAATGSYQTTAPQPRVQTSAGARASFALFGLTLGGLACFFMYMSNAGRQLGVIGQVDVETANTMALGGVVIALGLVALALLIGFIGLFVRGLPMRRVPAFFLLGALLLYTSFQTLRIHPSNWPEFMAEVTRQLNSRTVE